MVMLFVSTTCEELSRHKYYVSSLIKPENFLLFLQLFWNINYMFDVEWVNIYNSIFNNLICKCKKVYQVTPYTLMSKDLQQRQIYMQI